MKFFKNIIYINTLIVVTLLASCTSDNDDLVENSLEELDLIDASYAFVLEKYEKVIYQDKEYTMKDVLTDEKLFNIYLKAQGSIDEEITNPDGSSYLRLTILDDEQTEKYRAVAKSNNSLAYRNLLIPTADQKSDNVGAIGILLFERRDYDGQFIHILRVKYLNEGDCVVRSDNRIDRLEDKISSMIAVSKPYDGTRSRVNLFLHERRDLDGRNYNHSFGQRTDLVHWDNRINENNMEDKVSSWRIDFCNF